MDQNQTQVQIPEPIRLFLDSCLWDKGIKDVPEEMKEEMIRNLAARLNSWMMHAALMHLPNEYADEFEVLSENTSDPNLIQEFFQVKVPNLDKVLSESMIEFKKAYVNG